MRLIARCTLPPLLALLATGVLAADDRMVVARDGSGDFTEIQDAIDSARAFPDRRIVIYIKNGVYAEKVKIHEWNTRLSLLGESRDGTIIAYDDHFDRINRGRNSTFHTATLQAVGDDFRAANLSVKNSAGPVGQAIALAANADRVSFHNVSFSGNQPASASISATVTSKAPRILSSAAPPRCSKTAASTPGPTPISPRPPLRKASSTVSYSGTAASPPTRA
jgi:pectinesterase